MDKTQNPNSGVSTDPRICVFSQRNLGKLVSRCGHYEFEDVIAEVDDVEVLAPEPYRSYVIGEKLANRLARHVSIASLNPGVKKLRLNKSYDLFFAIFEFTRDLFSLNAVKDWKQRCRTSVCWVDDVWVGELYKLAGHLKLLSKFDYVLLNCIGSIPKVQDAINRPCSYIPPGVDMFRFCPYPNPPDRSIDVYSMGRKSSVTHQALLKMAEQKQFFYIYDTFENMETLLPRDHRILLANIAKRSRYFIANTAKINRQCETHGQSEVGFRFFEGVAAGTVVIGEPPGNDAFKEHFDWPDAVIKVPYDTLNIADILAQLDAQPERLEKIRKNNVIHSLLRHDWVYRWRSILNMVGLEPRPALIAREKRLKKLAEDIEKNS